MNAYQKLQKLKRQVEELEDELEYDYYPRRNHKIFKQPLYDPSIGKELRSRINMNDTKNLSGRLMGEKINKHLCPERIKEIPIILIYDDKVEINRNGKID